MPPLDHGLGHGPGGIMEELTVRAVVNGTTFMATYVIEDGAVLLASADFGEVSMTLEGLAPDDAAARLLREMAVTAMARSSVPFMRDDEINVPETPGV